MDIIAEIIAHNDSGPQHRLLRLRHANLANEAQPGYQLQIGGLCLPILRSNKNNAWIEVLYRQEKAPELAKQKVGEKLKASILSKGVFSTSAINGPTLLIADENGLAAILFLSLSLASQKQPPSLVLLGTQNNFPFRPQPSLIMLPQLPAHAIATLPLLEDRHIACRLAHTQGIPGGYDGSITALAQIYLKNTQEKEITIFASGTHILAQEIQTLAQNFGLTQQFLTSY